MTHTERTHVMFGVALALMGALALIAEARGSRQARTAWPVLAILIGITLFIPVESQTRTYQTIDWGSFLLTLAPDDPSAWVGDWITRLRAGHVVQHKIGGLLTMFAGVLELCRARSWLSEERWPQALPLCLLGTAVAFGVHGGTSHHLPFSMEQAQHRMLALALGSGGLTLGLHRAGALRHRGWALTWSTLVLLAGVSLAAFYRLPTGAPAHREHSPADAVLMRGGAR